MLRILWIFYPTAKQITHIDNGNMRLSTGEFERLVCAIKELVLAAIDDAQQVSHRYRWLLGSLTGMGGCQQVARG